MTLNSTTCLGKPSIGIIGGGVSGSTIAMILSGYGLNVTVIEKGPMLINGNPMCHLHSGGILYPELPEEEAFQLLKETIEFASLFNQAIDCRPTFAAIPIDHDMEINNLLDRALLIKKYYTILCAQNSFNYPFGRPEEFLKILSKKDISNYSDARSHKWVFPIKKYLELSSVKDAYVLINEFGINWLRMSSIAELTLKKAKTVKLLLNHDVNDLDIAGDKWSVFCTQNSYKQHPLEFDYLIDATGRSSLPIAGSLEVFQDIIYELKAAYFLRICNSEFKWPEIALLGERRTEKSLVQSTPYQSGYFQIHYMSEQSTLFENGLIVLEKGRYDKKQITLINELRTQINKDEVHKRTLAARDKLEQYIPIFGEAKVCGFSFYGIQQVPGNDINRRAADVSFPLNNLAVSQIVKASSSVSVATHILNDIKYKFGIKNSHSKHFCKYLTEKNEIDIAATKIAELRELPSDLAGIQGDKFDI